MFVELFRQLRLINLISTFGNFPASYSVKIYLNILSINQTTLKKSFCPFVRPSVTHYLHYFSSNGHICFIFSYFFTIFFVIADCWNLLKKSHVSDNLPYIDSLPKLAFLGDAWNIPSFGGNNIFNKFLWEIFPKVFLFFGLIFILFLIVLAIFRFSF